MKEYTYSVISKEISETGKVEASNAVEGASIILHKLIDKGYTEPVKISVEEIF